MNYTINFADKKDDSAIRRLLSNNPMPGSISVSFEKEPSYFKSLEVQGFINQVIVTKDAKGEVVGCGTRSVQKLFINEKATNVGYLSNLRVDKNHRRKGILRNGFEFLRKLDEDELVDYYYTTVVEENKLAKKIFLSNKKGFPHFYDLGKINTYIIFLNKKMTVDSNLAIEKCSYKMLKEMVDYINETGKSKNFFPYISENDFREDLNLTADNFYCAFRGEELVGVIGVWDQSQFKQTIVRNYGLHMRIFKELYNFYCKFNNLKKLPKVGEKINFFYLTYIAISNDDSDIFKALVSRIINDNVSSNYLYFILALHEKDKLNKAMENYENFLYKSNLYLVSWKRQDALLESLTSKVPYIEVSRL